MEMSPRSAGLEKKRAHEPNKGCNEFSVKGKEVEKSRKESHFKKREESPFASFLAFLSVFALVF
jgi:hypothetical protein